MRIYFVIIILLINTAVVFGQKKSVVNLISSSRTEGTKRNGVDVIKVYKGVFQQDFSTLKSDSAYFYQQQNAFDAFGHVVITQGDTLNIYSDKLNYNGNTKVAILTDNVRMVDKDATLTTNYLTYNTATRIGTYTGGGKLVNKQNTLTSKNGYYFAFSRDAYFRYNVLLTTNDALIKTDTLRYNSGSRIAYFYGPTNIYGKKDKDTLYTENGTYNTVVEQAFFGKKNLYKQGTKSLKGDSLFYDKIKGYGKAVKNITFNDNEQRITLKGDLGEYYRQEERTVVTKNAYVIIVTEEKDTTKKDTATKTPSIKAKNAKTVPAVNLKNMVKKDAAVGHPTDSLHLKTDTVKAVPKVKRDSIYMAADTLTTQIVTFKDLKKMQEARLLLNDTTHRVKAASIVYKKSPKVLPPLSPPVMPPDTSFIHPDIFGHPPPPAPVVVKKTTPAPSTKKAQIDSLKQNTRVDSVYATRKVALSDTSRIRILSAFHMAKLFKSDLQGKADSIFYSNSDSTIRCYVNPIMWTQGSQMSGDTINLQMKNKKLDNMELYPSAFLVNVEKNDSTHFNQVAGKKMRGFFKDNKMQRLYVDGNAESIYFSRDSTQKITGMQRSLSSRLKVNFKDNKATDLTFMGKPENRYGPMEKFKEDDRMLRGFIWKPKERPVSKESIIPSLNKQSTVKKTSSKNTAVGKSSAKGKPGTKVVAPPTVTNKKPTGKPLPPSKTAIDTTKRDTSNTDSTNKN